MNDEWEMHQNGHLRKEEKGLFSVLFLGCYFDRKRRENGNQPKYPPPPPPHATTATM